jgi:TPR repeat protein
MQRAGMCCCLNKTNPLTVSGRRSSIASGVGILDMAAVALSRRLIWGLCLAISFVYAQAAEAGSRIALVIGMSAYRNVIPLDNADNDAKGVAQTLKTIGFEVTEAVDQPLGGLVKTINDFSFRAETADIALIYYAGHGVEVAGENFLIPVDVTLGRLEEIGAQALPLNSLLSAVGGARKLRVVILDSCRNNPFAEPAKFNERPATPGIVMTAADDVREGRLAEPSPQQGTLVVYAAKAGDVALDGEGGHSPFARALIDRLPEKDTEIGMVFRKVRDEVMAQTQNRQEPHFYGSLPGIPYFLAGGDAALAALSDRRAAWGALGNQQRLQLAALAGEGNVRALIGLGYMSLSPGRDNFEPGKAFRYFSDAADKGDPEAMFELAKLYEKGIGTAQDFGKALSLYKRSADLGFADAINDLGFFYYQGAEGVKRDPEKAVALFVRAADLKHPQAMYNVAALIDDGVIKGKTPQDAARYLYAALRSGVKDVLAQLTERPEQFKLPTRKALQKLLADNGFYKGALDGGFGKGTVRSLQLAYGE